VYVEFCLHKGINIQELFLCNPNNVLHTCLSSCLNTCKNILNPNNPCHNTSVLLDLYRSLFHVSLTFYIFQMFASQAFKATTFRLKGFPAVWSCETWKYLFRKLCFLNINVLGASKPTLRYFNMCSMELSICRFKLAFYLFMWEKHCNAFSQMNR